MFSISTCSAKCDPNILGSNPSSLDGNGSVTVYNGMVVYDSVLPGAVAHLVCNEGYVGSYEARDRICLNGTWTDGLQICGKMILATIIYVHSYLLKVLFFQLLQKYQIDVYAHSMSTLP